MAILTVMSMGGLCLGQTIFEGLIVQAYIVIGGDDPGSCDTIGSTMDYYVKAGEESLILGGTTNSYKTVKGIND